MQWISVKDRLPDFLENVLTFRPVKGKYSNPPHEVPSIRTDYLDSIGKNGPRWSRDSTVQVSEITHWMPLPEEPRK